MNYRLTYDKGTPGNSKKNLPSAGRGAVDSRDVDLRLQTTTSKTSGDICDDSDSDRESDEEDGVGGEGDEASSRVKLINKEQVVTGAVSATSVSAGEDAQAKKARKKKDREEKMRRTMEMIVREQWADMMQFDELNREIAAGRILNGFIALQPQFYPTFKRTRNLSIVPVKNKASFDHLGKGNFVPTDRVVQDFYNEKRMPSFTDRILYKSMPAFHSDVTPSFFEACEQTMSSDHKAVRAGFVVKITKGSDGIFLDKNILKWKGKRSSQTSGKRTDVSMLQFVVSNLRGENLEEMDSQMFGGGSDPYVVITTDPDGLMLYKGTFARTAREEVKSKVIKHDLNPVWSEDISFSLASIDLAGLAQNASLIFSVWDEDLYNADDLIGVVSFPLRDVIEENSSKGTFTFSRATLHSNSEVMGMLSGTITIVTAGNGQHDSIASIHDSFAKLPPERIVSLSTARSLAEVANDGCACALS